MAGADIRVLPYNFTVGIPMAGAVVSVSPCAVVTVVVLLLIIAVVH